MQKLLFLDWKFTSDSDKITGLSSGHSCSAEDSHKIKPDEAPFLVNFKG